MIKWIAKALEPHLKGCFAVSAKEAMIELDPEKKYLLVLRESDITEDDVKLLADALRDLGINNTIILTANNVKLVELT